MAILAVLAAAAAAILAVALARARTRTRRLEQGLETATASLEHLERAFARFAPADVVDRIADGREVAAEERDVTVMFADIQGFTTLSERIPSATMIEILNLYFTAMNEAIVANRGKMSRMMGDGLLALFGALERNPWHPADAARAAIDMRAALARLNGDLERRGLPRLAFGVGLHRGSVVAAVMGSSDMMEYTVIGDVVNTAARVESLTRTHGVDILVTADVRRDLDDRFRLREMPPATVKGKTEPVATFTIERYAG